MYYYEWLNQWLEYYVRASAKPRTYLKYYDTVKKHVAPVFGKYRIEELTPFTFQRYVTGLLETGNLKTSEGLATSTVNGIITVIRLSLKTAFELGVTKTNAAEKLRRPRNREQRVECFTVAEQRKMEKFIFKTKRAKLYGILLCLYTGIRVGELLALKWSDIDLEKGVLHVLRTCRDGKDENGRFTRVIGDPKTESSKRDIPLPGMITAIFTDLRREKKNWVYIVDSGRSNLITVRNYQACFSRFLERLNIPHRGFHSLRHTFATRAIECGMDVRTLSEILGHKNPSVTLRRYVHSLPEHKREMMNKLNRFL